MMDRYLFFFEKSKDRPMAGIYKSLISLLVLFAPNTLSLAQTSLIKADVCVYGATSSGVIAAYTAKKLGKSVVVIEPSNHLGGLTSGGLGYTDIGNKYVIQGLALDFYRKIGKHYGDFEQWIFEPHVAEQIFQQYIHNAKINVLYRCRLVSVKKQNGYITKIQVEHNDKNDTMKLSVQAKMFIDCSYEGDLMAKARVPYFVGREDNKQFNETYDGVQLMNGHQFPDGIDPYKVEGDSASGLLWGISKDALQPNGTGDKKVQAYCFRTCLTNDPSNRIEIKKPINYDSTHYNLFLRYINKIKPKDLNAFFIISLMPNHKTDINNNGPFSIDMIGMNYAYPEGNDSTRQAIKNSLEDYTKGLFYFIGHDHRMPVHLRESMLQWGYPKDEYTDNNNWTPQMYVREARRMKGAYVMTQANCQGRKVVNDGIGMAAYTMDSHNCQRIVVNGMVKNEGNVEIGGFDPYPISYRSIIPQEKDCKNLLVPVCLSATHIAYGSIRMEPVFMVLGQSAGVAAAVAIDTKNDVQSVDVNRIKHILITNPLADGSQPDILIDNDNLKNVTITGKWNIRKEGAFGLSLLTTEGDSRELKSVQYSPNILKSGFYNVHLFLSKPLGMSDKITIFVKEQNKIRKVIVHTKNFEIKGQTSGTWVSIGKYRFTKGNKTYVEITNKDADGLVVADAVLFSLVK